jgi:xylanolytic transcriptional activator XlnR
VRERKKRGKASRKDIQQQQAAAAAAAGVSQSTNGFSSDGPSPTGSIQSLNGIVGRASLGDLQPPAMPASRTRSLGNNILGAPAGIGQDTPKPNLRTHSLGDIRGMAGASAMDHHHHQQLPALNQHLSDETSTSHISRSEVVEDGTGLGLNGYDRMQDFQHPTTNDSSPCTRMNEHMLQNRAGLPQHAGGVGQSNGVSSYGDASYAMLSPQGHHGHSNGFPEMSRPCDSPLTGFLGNSSANGSPGWLSLPSMPTNVPPTNSPQQHHHLQPAQTLRYPVLRPLLPHIEAFMPISLACDLLDLYFASSFLAYGHPLSPYILGYVFRKRSFLHPANPRPCSPALLASMLWVAAQTSDAPSLTVSSEARLRTCQKLLELTVGLLKPLIHVPSSGAGSKVQTNQTGILINGVTLGEPGVAMPATAHRDQLNGSDEGAAGPAGSLDDVATYIHLACIVSSSEHKAASLRWWYAACCLARELKLNRELPLGPGPGVDSVNSIGNFGNGTDADGEGEIDIGSASDNHQSANMLNGSRNAQSTTSSRSRSRGNISEEEREERRRIWWLLYIADRHLALCYNRPLALLDVECDGLLLPVDEAIWQFGDVYSGESIMQGSANHRRRGPGFECTGHSIFGYFLPLMAILGEIVDLHHARNHPRFRGGYRNDEEWDAHESEISQQLELYGRSLREFEARHLPGGADVCGPGDDRSGPSNRSGDGVPSMRRQGSRMTESEVHTRTVVAYGTHVMHVLHILLTGRWDPVSLLDDSDLWISSPSFMSSTGHAVSAAEAINDILEYDPNLSFMPFFFGIYLLQSSFLLLLIIDKFQNEANSSVIKACETIVRAHEASSSTVSLNTEYQVRFKQTLLSLYG